MKFKLPKKVVGAFVMALAMIAIVPTMASAHCDTMDGPVISDAQKAIEEDNLNYVLKWVFPEDEAEIKEAFELAKKVRTSSPEAQELADQYFFQNLVRIHRAGEGAPYTGVKPLGTPVEEAVAAADKSIELENLTPFGDLIPEERMPGLEERFEKILATKDFDVNDVEAGREFVEAYVQFTHYAEGEEHEVGHGEEGHGEEAAHEENGHADADVEKDHENAAASEEAHGEENEGALTWLPWSLAGLFFVTTIIGHFRKHKH